jgi:hypothetical protein
VSQPRERLLAGSAGDLGHGRVRKLPLERDGIEPLANLVGPSHNLHAELPGDLLLQDAWDRKEPVAGRPKRLHHGAIGKLAPDVGGDVPLPDSLSEGIVWLDWKLLPNLFSWRLIELAATVAFLASLETLLCATAIDQLHSGRERNTTASWRRRERATSCAG